MKLRNCGAFVINMHGMVGAYPISTPKSVLVRVQIQPEAYKAPMSYFIFLRNHPKYG